MLVKIERFQWVLLLKILIPTDISKGFFSLRKAMKITKRWVFMNLAALFFALLQINIYDLEIIKKLEYNASDLWFKSRGTLNYPREVLIAGIETIASNIMAFLLFKLCLAISLLTLSHV